jgi:hypothetical protein
LQCNVTFLYIGHKITHQVSSNMQMCGWLSNIIPMTVWETSIQVTKPSTAGGVISCKSKMRCNSVHSWISLQEHRSTNQ